MSKGRPNVRASRTPRAFKHLGVRKVLGLQYTGPKHVRVSIQAPGLMHENRMISMPDGCQTQASRLFRQSNRLPTYRVVAFVLSRVPPKEVACHFIQLVTNLLGEEGGLHGIYGNGGHC